MPTVNLTPTQQILKRWKMHRNALIVLVDKLPESGASFKPWSGAMTTVELIHHIAWVPDFFFAAIEEREPKIPPVPATVADASKLLADLTREHEEVIRGYSENDLQKIVTVKALNVTEPVVEVLHRLIGHEAHHKGQLWTYSRMFGVEPPFYVDLSV